MLPSINFLLLLVPMTIANSAQEKWSWPESPRDQKLKADNRRDIYYENFEQSSRIRVPTSYDDNRRPFQAYQAPVTIKSKPLSDEFSDESGENYSNNINGGGGGGFNNNRKPNRQQDGFQQFGGVGQFGGAGQLPFGAAGLGGGPALFPGQGINGLSNGFGHGGFPNYNNNFNPAIQGHSAHSGFPPIHSQQGGYPNVGFPPHNDLRNGILVGPGGPTGIIGRPYGGGGYGIFPGAGLGHGQQHYGGGGVGFNGPHGVGFNQPGGFGGIHPQGGGIYGGGYGGGGIYQDSTNKNQNNHQNFKRVEKSIQ